MGDPIMKAIQGAIVSLLFSAPAIGGYLSRLELRQTTNVDEAVRIKGDVLYFNRESAKKSL